MCEDVGVCCTAVWSHAALGLSSSAGHCHMLLLHPCLLHPMPAAALVSSALTLMHAHRYLCMPICTHACPRVQAKNMVLNKEMVKNRCKVTARMVS